MLEEKEVLTKEKLYGFIAELQNDFIINNEEWQNIFVEPYLEAICAWLISWGARQNDINIISCRISNEGWEFILSTLLNVLYYKEGKQICIKMPSSKWLTGIKSVAWAKEFQKQLSSYNSQGYNFDNDLNHFFDNFKKFLNTIVVTKDLSYEWAFISLILLAGKYYE